jgi:hypothetical protein
MPANPGETGRDEIARHDFHESQRRQGDSRLTSENLPDAIAGRSTSDGSPTSQASKEIDRLADFIRAELGGPRHEGSAVDNAIAELRAAIKNGSKIVDPKVAQAWDEAMRTLATGVRREPTIPLADYQRIFRTLSVLTRAMMPHVGRA